MTMVAVWFVALSPLAVSAVGAGSISFELGISTDLNLLRDPTNRQNQQAAARKTRSEMAVSRQTPLAFDQRRDADITGLSIDLNDADFVFDAIVIAEAPAGGSGIQSPLDGFKAARRVPP
jgi:hypothetical protein